MTGNNQNRELAQVVHPTPDSAPDTSSTNLWAEHRAHILGGLLTIGLFVLALWALHRALAGVTLDSVLLQFRGASWESVLIAALLTVCSYTVLVGYDVVGLKHIGRKLAFPQVALTSFIAFAFSNNIGVAVLSGGSIRYRIYSAAGLSAAEIASLVTLIPFTFSLGAIAVAASVVTLDASSFAQLTGWPVSVLRVIGASLLIALLSYVLWTAIARPTVRLRQWVFTFPPLPITLCQLALAALDLLLSASVLYVLLPDIAGLGYSNFVGVYLVAVAAGMLSHLPGGVGVFEAVIVHALPGAPLDSLVGTLLVFRCIYYLGPLLVAAALMAVHEFHVHRPAVSRFAAGTGDWLVRLAPPVFGVVVLLAGAVLLISGATPVLDDRLVLVRTWLPLPVVELSHMLASVAGLALLVVARGLFQRLDAAWQLTIALLVAGIVLSFLKGFDYEEAVFLTLVLGALYLGRGAFYRRASLLTPRYSTGWLVTLLVIVVGSIWIGIFSYKHLEYSESLWWKFSFDGDAPRYLRASLLVVVLGTALALAKLLHPASPLPAIPDPPMLARAVQLAGAHGSTNAGLVAIGDKRLLFCEDGEGFLMYQTRAKSWVVLGDPVGTPERVDELLWRFLELCDEYGGRPVFYEIGTEYLPLYLDLGMSMLKLGEEARIRLADFSLEGSARADLRQTRRRAQRDGLVFSVVPKAEVESILPQLRTVSDSWLAQKRMAEKSFSLGYFDAQYLCGCAIALIRDRSGSIVAFANLIEAAGRKALSVDLMRHSDRAPASTMDFLFIELFLWGREHGYEIFNLGMAPLSGLESHRLAPVWHRVGNLLFRHSEHFYNFEGLRQYKQKFHPDWQPRYLAARGGADMARALLDVSLLINEEPG